MKHKEPKSIIPFLEKITWCAFGHPKIKFLNNLLLDSCPKYTDRNLQKTCSEELDPLITDHTRMCKDTTKKMDRKALHFWKRFSGKVDNVMRKIDLLYKE